MPEQGTAVAGRDEQGSSAPGVPEGPEPSPLLSPTHSSGEHTSIAGPLSPSGSPSAGPFPATRCKAASPAPADHCQPTGSLSPSSIDAGQQSIDPSAPSEPAEASSADTGEDSTDPSTSSEPAAGSSTAGGQHSTAPDWQSMTHEQALATLDRDTLAVLAWVMGGKDKRIRHPEQLQARIESLEAQGEDFKVVPLLCDRVCQICQYYGPDHEAFMWAVGRLGDNENLRGSTPVYLYKWMLPRVVVELGLDHPRTRETVRRAAESLCTMADPREHTEYTQMVTDIAQQLPGGLGWGSTVVAPVPDEDAYARHVVMQSKADSVFKQKHYKLAKDMYQRCVAFCDTLGNHWLGTPRRVRAQESIGLCVLHLDGPRAAEAYMLEVKQRAQKELGANHEETLEATWAYAHTLINIGRREQAMSLFQRTLRVRTESAGARHHKTLMCQVSMAKVLYDAGKLTQAEAICSDAFETALKVCGPQGGATYSAYLYWTKSLNAQGKFREAEALEKRALRLGCKIDWL